MGHGAATNSIEVEAPALFDRVARKWNVDYAFYQTEPGKYLLFFKSGQAEQQLAKEKPQKEHIKEAVHGDR